MPANSTPDFAETTPEPAASNQLDFRAVRDILRQRIWLIGLCLLAAASLVVAYLYRTPQVFAARVVLQVEQEEQKVIDIQSVQKEDLQSQEYLKTVEQTLQSRSLLERILETNNLAEDPRFVGAVSPNGSKPSKEALVSKLAGMIQVRLRKGTRLIDITVEHQSPELTEKVGNSLVHEFLRQNFEQYSTISRVANQFLSSEGAELRRKLEESENALQEYRAKVLSVSFEDRQTIIAQKLKDLNVKATEAKTQRITQEAACKRMSQCSNNVQGLLGVSAVAASPAVIEARSTLTRKETELAEIKQEYKHKHPQYIQTESQVTEWKKALENAVLDMQETVRSTYESARASEQALEEAMRDQEAVALELNKQAIAYNALAREVESNRALYQSVHNRIKETELTGGLRFDRIRVVQPATIPEIPISPLRMQTALGGLFGGLAFGVLLALFLHVLDRSFNTVEQTEEYLGLPVLGAIPETGAPAGKRQLIPTDAAQSPEVESFRTLRTALSMLGRKEDRKTVLFTSALPLEGKTYCSLNYAASLARQGLRTLVIDCDLRSPMVERIARGDNKRGFGVTDYLVGEKSLEAIIQPTQLNNLFIIPAGSDAPNAMELLSQGRIDSLVEEAMLRFDRIVVDTPPIQPVSDALLVLGRIQTVCLVIQAHKTPKNAVLRSVQQLRQVKGTLSGVVLNRIRCQHGSGYYYGYCSYDYSARDKSAKKPKAQAVESQPVNYS